MSTGQEAQSAEPDKAQRGEVLGPPPQPSEQRGGEGPGKDRHTDSLQKPQNKGAIVMPRPAMASIY